MNRNKKIYCLFLLGIIFTLNGCRTSRDATSIALTKMAKEQRIEFIRQQAVPFNTLSSSLRFSIKPGMERGTTSANARLRIIKDNAIQLSLRVPLLEMEVARINITPDRITIIDRSNRRYFSESIQNFRAITAFDFNFYNLQALFTNQLFLAGKTAVLPADYNAFVLNEDDFLVRLNNTDNQGIRYGFTSDYTHRILQTEIYRNEVNMNWKYTGFGLTSNNRLFPMRMTMELTVPNDLFTMNLAFNNVDIDTHFELDTSIPNNFQPIGIEQVIRIIQSLQ
jgi:hypothetical protein